MRSILLRCLMSLACLWLGCGLAWAAPEAGSSRLPRDTTFVIDKTASMDGLPFELARQALLLGLERLRPSDWFNVIEVGSEAKDLFSGSVPAQASSVRQALSYARSLRVEGVTNSLPRFLAGCKAGDVSSSGLKRQVVLITDGIVHLATPALWKLERDLGDCRLFVVGVGALADTFFLRDAAAIGRGSFTHITQSSEVAPLMGVLFKQLESRMPQHFGLPWRGFSSSTSYIGLDSDPDQGAPWSVDGVVITDMAAITSSPSPECFTTFEDMQLCIRVLDTEKARSHRAKAEALVKAGKLKKAEAEYIQALVYDPTDEAAWLGLEALGQLAGFAVNREAMGQCSDGSVEGRGRFLRNEVILR